MGSLQQLVTDRGGVAQRTSLTGRARSFGQLGLDRQPDRADPDVLNCLEVLDLAGIEDGEAALDGRPGSFEVALPGGLVGLHTGDL